MTQELDIAGLGLTKGAIGVQFGPNEEEECGSQSRDWAKHLHSGVGRAKKNIERATQLAVNDYTTGATQEKQTNPLPDDRRGTELFRERRGLI